MSSAGQHTKIRLGLVFVWKLLNSNWWGPEANMWTIIVASIWTWILRNCQIQIKRSIRERHRAEMEYSKCSWVISGAICGGRIIRRHKNEGHIIQRRKFGLEPSCHHISDHAMAPLSGQPAWHGWKFNLSSPSYQLPFINLFRPHLLDCGAISVASRQYTTKKRVSCCARP